MTPAKIYVKSDNSNNYMRILEELYSKTLDSTLRDLYSATFILFCGTSLEYLLNDLLINYSNDHFGDTRQKKYAESLISIGFSAKLNLVLPIISGNKLEIDFDSFEYKTLSEIITKRNQIAHGKDYYDGLDVIKNDDGTISINLKDRKQNTFLNATKNQCENYMKAYKSFYENIYLAYENNSLSEKNKFISMIELNPNKRETINFE